ncbi:hypothetical protein P3X46_022226 [Hevea brasiliensis]|uniref:PGG domain-containing protein n=1 Tax=Hevea brasiliensis TaxID=3981 RepID=A0ABQ9L874_HEVBR|nr:ankyrin repeat-containing protein ITN1 [Hevea brasiliensis]KAJ9162454.1 hypothetical protein P3X46_022226 [Hevea brasiliensis]
MAATNTSSSLAGLIVNEKRTEANFDSWKECLKNYLIGQGLLGVVTGEDVEPKRTDSNYKDWEKKNALALHAIQISCDEHTFSNLVMKEPTKVNSAKFVWNVLAERQSKVLRYPEEETSSILQHNDLYMAVENDDWTTVKWLLSLNPNDVRAKITMIGQTALHVAVSAGRLEIVKELVKLMSKEDLELKNNFGNTAFALAAMNGSTDMAMIMLKKNKDLVKIKNNYNSQIPVVTASLYSNREIVGFLLDKTPIEVLSPHENDKNGATLLNCLIADEIYDLALDLLKRYPRLAFIEDIHKNYTITLLANKHSAFLSGSKLGFWKRRIYSSIYVNCEENEMPSQEASDEENVYRPPRQDSSDKRIIIPQASSLRGLKLKHAKAKQLLRLIFKEMPRLSNAELKKIGLHQVIYDAIKCGLVEFIEELISCNPDIIWWADQKGRTLFSYAIILRQEKIFSLIYELRSKMHTIVIWRDVFNNNFLHLAAKLPPSSQLDRVPGAALQMQTELQWFKEIEKMVPSKYKERVNENGETPSALFTKEHSKLVKEGESWIKSTVAQCMVVAILVATAIVTSTFQFPGGVDNSGFPLLSSYGPFLVFSISNALSLFSASTSVLIFLGILASRYAEEDFLESLPRKLIFGLSTLFFSTLTMMIAFGCSIFIFEQKKSSWLAIPLSILSFIPIAFFTYVLFPLLFRMVINKRKGYSFFDKSKEQLRVRKIA